MTVPPPGDATPPPPPPPPAPPTTPVVANSASNGAATASLVLGILSFVCLGILGSIPGVILGVVGKNKAKELGGTGAGQAKAGLIISIINIALSAILIVIFIIAGVFGADSAEKKIDKVSKDYEKTIDEATDKADRYGEKAKRSDYSIDDAEITDQTSYGSFTYKAYIENEADFKTGYDIDVECKGDAGDLDTKTAYVSNMREGSRKSFSVYFTFDSSNTTANCNVVEVRYGY